jgi:hypothetical protein
MVHKVDGSSLFRRNDFSFSGKQRSPTAKRAEEGAEKVNQFGDKRNVPTAIKEKPTDLMEIGRRVGERVSC